MGKKHKSKHAQQIQKKQTQNIIEQESSEQSQKQQSLQTDKTSKDQTKHSKQSKNHSKNMLGKAQKHMQIKKEVENGEQVLYSWEDVAKHDTKDDIWVVVQYNVYDVTKLIDIHPGGVQKILQRAGGDATKKFIEGDHPFKISSSKLEKWKVGHINPDSTIQMWQKEEQTGKMDAVWSIVLGVFMLGYMIYLTI